MSNYIKDILLFVVNVRAELFLNAQHFAEKVFGKAYKSPNALLKVMSAVVGECTRALCEYATRTPRHNTDNCQCALQCRVDLGAFDVACGDYMQSQAK